MSQQPSTSTQSFSQSSTNTQSFASQPTEAPGANGTYLVCRFDQKEAAKAVGARWDSTAKKWYAPHGSDLSLFTAWLPEGHPAKPAAAGTPQPAASQSPPSAEGTYLVCPFDQKEAAKALGARWDITAKKWYAPNGADLSLFAAWLPECHPAKNGPPSASPSSTAAAVGPILSPGRLYLNCPFAEKERAKEMGAQWDTDAKKWFVPRERDPRIFARWLPNAPPSGGGGGSSENAGLCQMPPAANPRYKTQMCVRFGGVGGCSFGSNCAFAHSLEELRQPESQSAPLSPSPQSAYSTPLSTSPQPAYDAPFSPSPQPAYGTPRSPPPRSVPITAPSPPPQPARGAPLSPSPSASAPPPSPLTQEQRDRMEQRRQQALALRAQKSAQRELFASDTPLPTSKARRLND